MALTGDIVIGSERLSGRAASFRATDPATGAALEPAFAFADAADVDRACALAAEAFDTYRETSPEARAAFLDSIADEIVALGDALIERACAESGLPRARIEGERGRTVGQLKLFASRGAGGSVARPPRRHPPARPQAPGALGPAPAPHPARPRGGLRRQQLPSRLLGRGRRHRLGARRRLSRRGQGPSGPSRHGRTRRPGGTQGRRRTRACPPEPSRCCSAPTRPAQRWSRTPASRRSASPARAAAVWRSPR